VRRTQIVQVHKAGTAVLIMRRLESTSGSGLR